MNLRNLQVWRGRIKIGAMQKQKGFTLLELMLTIVMVGILASISAPSFQQWQRDQRFISDTETLFDTLADARASAVSEKKCGSEPAKEWILEVDLAGVKLSCKQDASGELVKEIRSRQWASPAIIKKMTTDDVTVDNWTNRETLKIVIFQGGTQALINEFYINKWARINIRFEDLGKERTICYSRIANYPYYSKDGTCNDE